MNTPITQIQEIEGRATKIVQKDWVIYGFKVPAGFPSDGVSFLIKNNRAEAAGILHDFLRTRPEVTLDGARQMFRQKLRDDRVSVRYRTFLSCMLRLYDHVPARWQTWLRYSFLPK